MQSQTKTATRDIRTLCIIYSALTCSFDEFVGEKVVSPSYSSTILGPPPLGIHIEETRIERDTCTPMCIAALFIIARTWKQLRCPSADEWIRKLWYIYTMEYYSTIKKNTFESVLMRWMKL